MTRMDLSVALGFPAMDDDDHDAGRGQLRRGPHRLRTTCTREELNNNKQDA